MSKAEAGDVSFANYEPTATDPGPWVMVFVIIYCLLSVAFMPALIACVRKLKCRVNCSDPHQPLPSTYQLPFTDHPSSSQGVEGGGHVMQSEGLDRSEYDLTEKTTRVPAKLGDENASKMIIGPQQVALQNMNVLENETKIDAGEGICMDRSKNKTEPFQSKLTGSFCSCRDVTALFDNFIFICELDKEMRKIIALMIPFVLSTVSESVFDLIFVAFVGNFIGTNALVAYTVTLSLIGITDSFILGISDAEITVCSHAIGVGDNVLCGQYVQLAIIIYLLYSIPVLAIWWLFIYDVLEWMGLGENIAQQGQEFTRVVVFHFALEGVAESFMALLDVSGAALYKISTLTYYLCTRIIFLFNLSYSFTHLNSYVFVEGHATFGTIVDIVEGLMSTCVVAIVVTTTQTKLTTIALIQLGVGIVSFLFALFFSLWKGWLNPFLGGLKLSLPVSPQCFLLYLCFEI